MDWATRCRGGCRGHSPGGLQEALARYGRPEIFNPTRAASLRVHWVQQAGVAISNTTSSSRLWRSLKYECVYLHFEDGRQARRHLASWLRYYNEERPHSSLAGDRTPMEAYTGRRALWTICQGWVDYPTPSKTAILQSRKGGLRPSHNESTLILLPGCPKNGVHLTSMLSFPPS